MLRLPFSLVPKRISLLLPAFALLGLSLWPSLESQPAATDAASRDRANASIVTGPPAFGALSKYSTDASTAPSPVASDPCGGEAPATPFAPTPFARIVPPEPMLDTLLEPYALTAPPPGHGMAVDRIARLAAASGDKQVSPPFLVLAETFTGATADDALAAGAWIAAAPRDASRLLLGPVGFKGSADALAGGMVMATARATVWANRLSRVGAASLSSLRRGAVAMTRPLWAGPTLLVLWATRRGEVRRRSLMA